jgi:hypothetical protein
MQLRKSGLIVLAASLTIGLAPGFGQASAKQDMKNAGTETKDATKDVGHGIAKGSKKAYHSTAHGTKVATHKTADASKTAAHKTKKAVDKVEGKPAPQ